jgi:DNA polymerase I-like protein with 3'-5' exonuclease and polymerase domains
MYHIPGIEGLHALKDSLHVIATAKLPIGSDNRNRPSLFPFGTASGRNAHCRSLYNAHAAMRSFMVFPSDRIGAYLDWRTQEVAIAAARSGDQALLNAYRQGDVYYSFACDSGLTSDPDRAHWAKHDQSMRQRMKVLQLGINYGMGVPSLAKGLNRHPLVASNLIEQHRRMYASFWQWRDQQVQIAMLERRMQSLTGWPLHISVSPNKRTLCNFPMQSGGADMLRLATVQLCDAGIVPCMLIHDGILLEVESQEQLAHAVEIMRKAGAAICDGLDVGVDIDQQLEGGARYRDKRPMAQNMWGSIMRVLESIRAIPRSA